MALCNVFEKSTYPEAESLTPTPNIWDPTTLVPSSKITL